MPPSPRSWEWHNYWASPCSRCCGAAYRGAPSAAAPAADAASSAVTVTASAAAAIASLSPRELDVLRGIVRGASNKEIARQHGIAETTVKIHVQHLLRKLDVSSRVHAAVIASENGVL